MLRDIEQGRKKMGSCLYWEEQDVVARGKLDWREEEGGEEDQPEACGISPGQRG